MPQNDFLIENQSAPDFRADLNDALEALATLSSGIGPPSNTYPNMLWYDTINSTLKIRTEADDGWIELFALNQSVGTAAPIGLGTIGQPFPVWDHLTGAGTPNNSGSSKFVRLTAGQSGAGGFNESLLINESVSGSAPLVEATAEIATGPMSGATVPLLNTEGSFARPGTSSGTLQQFAVPRVQGSYTDIQSVSVTVSGAISQTFQSISGRDSGTAGSIRTLNFDNALVTNTANEARPKNRQATYYMRIV